MPGVASAIAVGLAAALCALACEDAEVGRERDSARPRERTEKTAAPKHPVLLVGLDGFEWNVVLPLLAEGRLPHLASLIRRGVSGELRSLVPTKSPVIWTTIATGYAPERHGILDFKLGTGRESPLYTNSHRRTKAFWNVASDYGLRVGVVGWWLTWPVEPINGVMVSAVNSAAASLTRKGVTTVEGAAAQQVHPAARSASVSQLTREIGDSIDSISAGIFGPWDASLGEVPNRLWENTRWSIRGDEVYRRLTLELLAEEPGFDLLATYVGGSDVVAHRFWRYMEPASFQTPPTPREVAALGGYLARYYEHIDQSLGALMAAAPADAVTIVLSDHGMHAVHTNGSFEAKARTRTLVSGGHDDAPPCFFAAAGPGIRSLASVPRSREDVRELGSVFDLAPTLFALLDLPIPQDFPGRVLTEIIEPGLLVRQPLRQVPTHTPEGWYDERAKPDLRLYHEAERKEQLRALGYIE